MTNPRASYYLELEVGVSLADVAQRCVCECGAALVMLMKADKDGVGHHHLRCGNGHVDPKVVPSPSTYQSWKQGQVEVPIYIHNQYLKILRKEMESMNPDPTTAPDTREQPQEDAPTKAKPSVEAMVVLARRTTLTPVQANALINYLWPNVPDEAKMQAAILCAQYRLNPLMKHIALVKFNKYDKGVLVGETWEPILTIKASRLIAQREGSYSYDVWPRLMTKDEQVTANGEYDENNWWALTVIRDQANNQYPGYGNYPKTELDPKTGKPTNAPYGYDKGNRAQHMAMIRAERDAFNKFAPGKMPDEAIEVVDESIIEGRVIQRELPQETPKATQPPTEPKSDLRVRYDDTLAKAKKLGIKPPAPLSDDAPDHYIKQSLDWLESKIKEADDRDALAG